jgi:Kef-type K+ transport system membrane component KefB
MIAFTIGQNFSFPKFREIGKMVLVISVCEAIGAWIFVTAVFSLLLKQPFHVAILFGAIASATAPAATVMVINEYKARGLFTNILLGVVAVDDAWCLIIFAVSLALSRSIAAHLAANSFVAKVALRVLLEIGGAFVLGAAVAFLLKFLSRLITTRQELQIYIFGFVLLVVGVALSLHISVLLSALFLGATLVNIEKNLEQKGFFESLKTLEPILYMLFFILAGANLSVSFLKDIGWFGLAYLVFRVIGKYLGSFIGAVISRAPAQVKRFVGLGLIPQAGVALGVALVVKTDFPEVGRIIFDTIVATTIVYELIGPVFSKISLDKAGDIPKITPEKKIL